MYFLLRSAFWIGLAFLVMPALFPPQPARDGAAADPPAATPAPAAGAPDPALLFDAMRFCADYGKVCEAGFTALEGLGEALAQGLALVGELTGDAPRPVATAAVQAAGAGTLTETDVAEPWRGAAAPLVAGSTARLRLPPPDPRRRPQG
jgi:hypothetical protein